MTNRYFFVPLAVVTVLAGCSLLNPAPTNSEALEAVRGMGDELFGASQLPPGFRLASVVVQQCVKQENPEGHVCDVKLISAEIPVIGAISLPMNLRFAKRDGRWKAFLY